jgi:hypothetical protein
VISRGFVSENEPIDRRLQDAESSHPVYRSPIRDAAVVLTPRGFLCVLEKIISSEVVAGADFGAAQSEEVFLSHVSARAIEAVCFLMVDPFDLETLMQVVP